MAEYALMAPICHSSSQTEAARARVGRLFTPALLTWQVAHGRHGLPWQQTRNPYRVWLSEIMLQQTQVATVLRYYSRFVARFPDVHTLCAATVDEVMALWSGLGYYSRARNLHRCAQMVVHEYGGTFPTSYETLMSLPGIGRSTAAAIAAFCFDAPVSILDGNVKRVLTRVFAENADISSMTADRALWTLAQTLVPGAALQRQFAAQRPQGVDFTAMACYTQGLMDLGALVCLPRRVDCARCPMQEFCLAHACGKELMYPVKTRKVKRSARTYHLLWLESARCVWLEARPARGIWGGLYSLPMFADAAECDAALHACGVAASAVERLPAFKHVLTHMDLMLQPLRVTLKPQQVRRWSVWTQAHKAQTGRGDWFKGTQWPELGMPAPVRKLLEFGSDSQN